MDRQSSAPGASAISEGSGNLGASSIASSHFALLRTADAGIARTGESLANPTISVRPILGRAPNALTTPDVARELGVTRQAIQKMLSS
jgi:hypothetical protein